MPSDLFGTVSSRRAASRSRRPSLLFISAVGHLVVFLLIIVVSLRATGPLPEPRARVVFTTESRVVQMINAPRRPARRPLQASSVAIPMSSTPMIDSPRDTRAPVEPPPTIDAEPQDASGGGALARFTGPPQIGVDHGDGSSGTGLGPVERVEPRPAVRRPQRLAPGIREPRKVFTVTPAYPRLAEAAHIQGTVILEITVGEKGGVDAIAVLRSVPALDQAAIDAVRRWRYESAELNGTPIPVIITVTVNFSLAR